MPEKTVYVSPGAHTSACRAVDTLPDGGPMLWACHPSCPVTYPKASPTGQPVIPARLVPYFLFGTSALVLVAEFLEEGPMTATRWIRLAVGILTLALGASPGLRRGAKRMAVLVVPVVTLSLQACAPSLHTHPAPIGEPGPAACFAASEAHRAWLTYVEPYVRAVLEAQETHSCQPVPVPPAQSDVPSIRARPSSPAPR